MIFDRFARGSTPAGGAPATASASGWPWWRSTCGCTAAGCGWRRSIGDGGARFVVELPVHGGRPMSERSELSGAERAGDARPWRRGPASLAVVAGPRCGLGRRLRGPDRRRARDHPAERQYPTTCLQPSSTTVPGVGRARRRRPVVDRQRRAAHRAGPATSPTSARRPRSAALLAGAPPIRCGPSIPGGTELLGTTEDGGTLTVNLSEQINAIQGEELKRALAQIVWTSTEDATISGCWFQVNGEDAPRHHRRRHGSAPVEPGRLPVAATVEEPTTTTHPTARHLDDHPGVNDGV